jgi:hypothetical protein
LRIRIFAVFFVLLTVRYQLYPSGDSPRYITGHAVTMSLVGAGIIIYAIMYFFYKQENRKRARGDQDQIIKGLTEEECLALGDRNPRFTFAA